MPVEFLKIIADIKQHTFLFDFDRNNFGESAVYEAASAIEQFTESELDEDGTPFAPLSPNYERWKSRAFPGQPIAMLHHHMRTFDQMIGLYRIAPHEVRQTYGVDELARETAASFQEGGGGAPPRRFYAFNTLALHALDHICDQRFSSIK